MDDGIPPAGGSHRFEPPAQEDPRHQRENPVEPIKGKGNRQASSATLKQRTTISYADWYIQRHQTLLGQKHVLSCQKVFTDSLEEIRSSMRRRSRQSQHFKISYLDDSGKKITVIPPDPALLADPVRLKELLKELDLELKPLERQLKPQRATIHKRLNDVEQALTISKTQLQEQNLEIPHDPGAPDTFFLGNDLLEIPEPDLLSPRLRQPENHEPRQASKIPKNKALHKPLRGNHRHQADTERHPAHPGTPSPFQKEVGFEFSTRPTKKQRANDPVSAGKQSKPPRNAHPGTEAKVAPDYEVKPPSTYRRPTPEATDSETNSGNIP
ncbi:MAG: hypothetical protein ACPG5T_10230, partial [Endozoicomonas sp.]